MEVGGGAFSDLVSKTLIHVQEVKAHVTAARLQLVFLTHTLARTGKTHLVANPLHPQVAQIHQRRLQKVSHLLQSPRKKVFTFTNRMFNEQ